MAEAKMPKPRKPRSTNNRDMPEGPERLCSRCKEWWPADASCFNRAHGGLLQSWCKACMSEQRKQRLARPAAQAECSP